MEQTTTTKNRVGWSRWLAPAVTTLARGLAGGGKANAARVRDGLGIEHWSAIADGRHNLTTDLCVWRDTFYLVHASSPWHIASHESKIVVWRSKDARDWQRAAEFRMEGCDIRDPKLGVIHGKLFLYVLRNIGFVAEPSATAFSVTEDGEHWSPLEDCTPSGWLFWRPKTRDGRVWYLPAYWHKHGKSVLLKSEDGVNWSEVSLIHEGDHNDETDIEFLDDGRCLATARLEMNGSLFGHRDACTLVAVAKPPYTAWRAVKCAVTRLDGPNLFSYRDRIFAAGRHHPGSGGAWNHPGSFLGRKRTSLYQVTPEGLEHLTDLPSQGDTGYPGIVVKDGYLYVCYYTNDIARDYRWVVGMFLPSEIRMAKLPLDKLISGGRPPSVTSRA